MPVLILPDLSVHESFLAGVDEILADPAVDPFGLTARFAADHEPGWRRPEGFQAFVDALRAQELPDTPRPAGWVPTTTLWWVDDTEFLGRLSIRHRLADGLTGLRNGHIGYEVRPSMRRVSLMSERVIMNVSEVFSMSPRRKERSMAPIEW